MINALDVAAPGEIGGIGGWGQLSPEEQARDLEAWAAFQAGTGPYPGSVSIGTSAGWQYTYEPPAMLGPPLTGKMPAGGVSMVMNGVKTGQPTTNGISTSAGGKVNIGGYDIPTDYSSFAALLAGAPAILAFLAKYWGVIASVAAVWAAFQAALGGRSNLPAVTGGGGGPGDVGLQGPGVPEPLPGTYRKTWRTAFEQKGTFLNGYTWFWLMNNGEVVYYSSNGKYGKYRPKKPIAVVMQGSNMGLRDFVRIDRLLDRFARRVAKRSSRLKLQRG